MSGGDRRKGPRHGARDELDRFTRFLQASATGYHAPPATPREKLWGPIEASLGAAGASAAGAGAPGVAGNPGVAGDPLTITTAGYHEPPPAPSDELWHKIEADWTARSIAEIRPLRQQPAAGGNRRWRVVPWLSGLAIAASLLIGIAIGRRSAEEMMRAEPGPVAVTPTPEEAASSVAGPDATTDAGPLETARPRDPTFVASDPASRPRGERPTGGPGAGVAQAEGPAFAGPDVPSRRATAVRYATLEHFGRAETLLTSFQAGSDEVVDLAGWAGRLLAETRLLLDLPVEREPGTRVLLEELELVLAQIAVTRSGSPGERELAAEGLERTLPRLRALAPAGTTGSQVGT